MAHNNEADKMARMRDSWRKCFSQNALVALLVTALILLCMTSADGQIIDHVTAGSSFKFIAKNLSPEDATIVWKASSGSPTSSTGSSFSWMAPSVDAPQDTIITCTMTTSSGCQKDYKFDILVETKKSPGISLNKDCVFSSPTRIGDRVLYTYNVTNVGGQPLMNLNLTDLQSWGPNCRPVYKRGDNGNNVLDLGESWWYECQYTIQDPAEYPMLHIMQSNINPGGMDETIQKLMDIKSRLEIVMDNMRRSSSQFDTKVAELETGNATINQVNFTSYNYTNPVTGESLSRMVDSMGNLNRTIYTDAVTGAVLTVGYAASGKIVFEEVYFPPPTTREYLKIEYDMPARGYRTITIIDYKTGKTLVLIVDAKGNILSKEFKIIPGYKEYEERYYLRNTATVTARTKEGVNVSDYDSFTLEVIRMLPVLAIVKSADKEPVDPGALLNYTIIYQNIAGTDAHDVVIRESYNKSVTFLRSDPSPDDGTIDRWSLGDLHSGELGKINIQTKVDPLAKPGSKITNPVEITCKEKCRNISIINTTVAGERLNITKSAYPNPISPDEILTYTIVYRNDGDTIETNVTIFDWLDSYVDLIDVTSNPLLNGSNYGDYYWWRVGDLNPGEMGTITIRVKVKPKDVFLNNATWLINTYKINSTQSRGVQASLETLVIHSLWIKKTADKKSYGQEENITYTIKYGNSAPIAATNVTVTDYLPDVMLISASPSPSISSSSSNLTWNIGTLKANESGTITIIAQIPKKANATFHETSQVNGVGYAYVRKELSTEEEKKSLTNRVVITGYYYLRRYPVYASSSVTLIGSPGTSILSREHGSGTYKESEKSSLFQENKSVSLDKVMFASYEPTTSMLPGDRSLEYDSLWSDRTDVENRLLLDKVSENYQYADTLNKSSSFQADMNQTVYDSQVDMVSGMARIKYKKYSEDRTALIQEIDENYHGSFRIEESVDSYGDSVKFSKSGKGKGFVSSDERVTGKLRSYDSGSGYYFSEETSQLASVEKITKMQYAPLELSARSVNITYANLWQEGMWTREKDKMLFISEKIQYATSVDKEAFMDESRLSVLGKFNGSLNMQLKNGKNAALDETFIGSYQIDTAIAVYTSPRHLYPHVNISKKAVMVGEDIVLFLINVSNDGNKLLKPLTVTDYLPDGCSFINSSIRAKPNGQMLNWTIPSLDISRTLTIKMWAKLDGQRSYYTNFVAVTATCKESILKANNSTTFEAYYQPLPCCLDGYNAINVTAMLNNTTRGYWGEWNPPDAFNVASNFTDCACLSNEYYDALEKNMTQICCASNYEVP